MSTYIIINVISLVCLVIAMLLMTYSNSRHGRKIPKAIPNIIFVVGILLLPIASLTGNCERFENYEKEEDK